MTASERFWPRHKGQYFEDTDAHTYHSKWQETKERQVWGTSRPPVPLSRVLLAEGDNNIDNSKLKWIFSQHSSLGQGVDDRLRSRCGLSGVCLSRHMALTIRKDDGRNRYRSSGRPSQESGALSPANSEKASTEPISERRSRHPLYICTYCTCNVHTVHQARCQLNFPRRWPLVLNQGANGFPRSRRAQQTLMRS